MANCGKVEPGLYNLAVLTLGPRLRYTRSLVRDLRNIVEKFSDEDLDSTALAQLFPHEPPQASASSAGSQQNVSRAPTSAAGGSALAASHLEAGNTTDSKPML